MSYLDRLKQKMREDGPRGEATKGTKAPSVPFVAHLSAPSRQISPEPEANQPEPVDRQELAWRVAVIHKAQGDSELARPYGSVGWQALKTIKVFLMALLWPKQHRPEVT